MRSDDPFDFESEDSKKTILIPNPDGRTRIINHSIKRRAIDSSSGSNSTDDDSAISSGLNPIIAAANPLLNIAFFLHKTIELTDLEALREFLEQGIAKFRKKLKTNRRSTEEITNASYALCSFLDECVASTPWGDREWGKQSLLIQFHKETFGGENFFLILDKLTNNPKESIDLIELMYICLTLGFTGRYAVMSEGTRKLTAYREEIASIIHKERRQYARDLSPNWKPDPFSRTDTFQFSSLWTFTSLCGLILLSIYLSFSYLLNAASDAVFKDIEIPIRTESFPLKPIEQQSWAYFLKEEIEAGLVFVRNEDDRSTVTLAGDGSFAPGSSSISEKFAPVLTRIAAALKSEEGQILIVGHTDNQPIRSLRFPSNWHLSKARAQSVMHFFATQGLTDNRLSAEGRAESDPVASNSTPEGRARNRRVEIVLIRPGKTQ